MMIDHLKRLLKGSAIYGIGNALNQFINLLLLPLFTSYLSPADYGVTSILSMFTLIIYNVFTLGFGTSIGLSYYQKDESEVRRKRVIWTSFIVLVFSGIISGLSGLILADNISVLLFDTNKYTHYVMFTLVSSFFSMLLMPFTLRLQFEEKQVQFVIITIFSTLVNIGLNILLIVYLKRGLDGRIEAIMLSSISTFLLYFIPSLRNFSGFFSFKYAVELIKYGLPLIPSFIALYVLQQGSIYFLQNFSDLENVGLFSVGFSFGSAILIIFSAFNTAWFPFAMSFEQKREEASHLFGKIFSYFVIGAGLLSGLFYLFAYPTVLIFTQPGFQSSYMVIGLTTTALCLLPVFSIFIIPLYYAKYVKILPVLQIFSAGIFIITGLILVPRYGIKGAAINMIIGYFVMALASYLWCHHHKLNYFVIKFEWARIMPFLIIYSFFIVNTFVNKAAIIDLIINAVIYLLLVISSFFILYDNERKFINDTIKVILRKTNRV